MENNTVKLGLKTILYKKPNFIPSSRINKSAKSNGILDRCRTHFQLRVSKKKAIIRTHTVKEKANVQKIQSSNSMNKDKL